MSTVTTVTLEERVRKVMDKVAPKQRRFKQLEDWTGVAADRWSAVSLGRQRPTAELIEALCKQFPEMSLWIATGTTDPSNKQWDVETAWARRNLSLVGILAKQRGQLTNEDRLVLNAAFALAQPNDDPERKMAKAMLSDIAELLETDVDTDHVAAEINKLNSLRDTQSNGNQKN